MELKGVLEFQPHVLGQRQMVAESPSLHRRDKHNILLISDVCVWALSDFTPSPQTRALRSHFTEGETEAQRKEVAYSPSCSQLESCLLSDRCISHGHMPSRNSSNKLHILLSPRTLLWTQYHPNLIGLLGLLTPGSFFQGFFGDWVPFCGSDPHFVPWESHSPIKLLSPSCFDHQSLAVSGCLQS